MGFKDLEKISQTSHIKLHISVPLLEFYSLINLPVFSAHILKCQN